MLLKDVSDKAQTEVVLKLKAREMVRVPAVNFIRNSCLWQLISKGRK